MSVGPTFRGDLLEGKVAFVAGASGGINLAIAQTLAGAGAKVGLISRNQDRIDAAAKSIDPGGRHARGLAADVRDYEQVAGALQEVRAQFGEIDIVVSGAAGNFIAPVIGMSSKAFRTVIEIDLIGTFNVYRACFEHLRKPGASLIAITAGLAVRPEMFQAHASAAKAGVNALTKTLAMEWGPAGVRVNAIAPGPIGDTKGMALAENPEGLEAAMSARLPLRRFGTKQDIAELALFLCSNSAKYITGVVIDADGGWMLGDASLDALTAPVRSNTRPQKD